MAIADDVKQLGKNQEALQKNFLVLKRRLESLERRVSVLAEGDARSADLAEEANARVPVPAKRRAAETDRSPKETRKPIENLGFKIFGAIGFLLILLGLFFFYRYAVENGWIGILGRVILGVAFSALILLAGELFRRRGYRRFGQMMVGGGLALLYFTFFATYFFREYREALGMTLGTNTILLALVIVVAVVLALREDSILLTCYAFFLGYLSAFLAGTEGSTHQMVLYTFLLSLGFAAILWRKDWPLSAYPMAASWLLFLFFIGDQRLLRFDPGQGAPSVVLLGLLYAFGFYALFSLLALLLKDDELHLQHIIMTAINSFAFFAVGLLLVLRYWEPARGLFVIGLAAASLLLAAQAKRLGLKNLFEAFWVLAITFLTIAIPVQLHGGLEELTTLAWAVEGLLLILAGWRAKHYGLRLLAYAILCLAGLRALLWDSHAVDLPWRFLGFAAITLACYAASSYAKRPKEAPAGGEQVISALLGVLGTLLLTVLLLVEIAAGDGLFSALARSSRQVVLSIAWALESVTLIVVGILRGSRTLRFLGLGLFGVTILKVLLIDLGGMPFLSRTIVTMGVGLLALLLSFVYVKNKERIQELLEER